MDTGVDVYDFLPPESAPYPFIFVGEQTGSGVFNNKDKRFISLMQTVHLYHNNYRQRGTVTSLLEQIRSECFKIDSVAGRNVVVREDNMQMITDNTTNTPLMHGIIDITYEIQ